jgi:hypothetical protein
MSEAAEVGGTTQLPSPSIDLNLRKTSGLAINFARKRLGSLPNHEILILVAQYQPLLPLGILET